MNQQAEQYAKALEYGTTSIEHFKKHLNYQHRMAIASSLPDSEAAAAEQLLKPVQELERLAAVLETVRPVLQDSAMLQAIARRLADSLRASAHAVDILLTPEPAPDHPESAQC